MDSVLQSTSGKSGVFLYVVVRIAIVDDALLLLRFDRRGQIQVLSADMFHYIGAISGRVSAIAPLA